MAISQSTANYSFKYKNFNSLKAWIDRVIKIEGAKTGAITIVFTSDDYLVSVNRDYLDHDYYTDVITFDYSLERLISGDILISVDRVKENAGIYEVGFNHELDRVILHGVLHLLGYRDSNELEISTMRAKETFYLQKR